MRAFLPWRQVVAAALLAAAVFSQSQPTLVAYASSDEMSRVVELTNLERIKAGLQPLVANTSLNSASQNYSGVLATDLCWAHTCGPEPEFDKRAASAGYTGWTRLGENIAAGQRTPEEVVASWMNSPGHRANILNPDFNEIGVGVVRAGKMGAYWTQMFGTRPNVKPAPAQTNQSAASAAPSSAASAPAAAPRAPAAELGKQVADPSPMPHAPEAPLQQEEVPGVPELTVEGVGENELPNEVLEEVWDEAVDGEPSHQFAIAEGDW